VISRAVGSSTPSTSNENAPTFSNFRAVMIKGKSVSGISSELGFDSPSSFIYMYKMMTGRSPGRFIELLKG
jgi:AraC-like DNA-binding protein